MPQSSRESKFSTRDGDDSRHGPSRHEERPRRHHDKRSPSPSGSPQRHSDREREHKKRRSAEGHHHHHRHHHHHSSSRTEKPIAAELPYGARHLSKDDLKAFEPLFAEYLSLQKQLDIADMDEREIRGRWKSFVGKWNRGELAEGWYDPEMFQRILARYPAAEGQPHGGEERQQHQHQHQQQYAPRGVSRDDERSESHGDDDSEDEDYGPVLPGALGGSRRVGAGIPNKEDLALRDELVEESREADREELRAARKADRKLQKERLEELVPRAEAGTRERKLEKRQEVNEKMRQFRDKSPGGEVRDSELMGGGDSLEEYKKAKEKEQRRKSEREIRREEMERARREEIEAKRRAWQEKEERTVSMLRELARQRFGGA
ncbi:hypothetical protein M440DRAFT_1375328 [Trichoderma longibrachiatum ATCC 18648]|uniref:RNA helicase HEL117 n=1 Tax=Trichoderma longibrachiatum ATCC 18648 TaxID=983965 RepID=A0A2T4C8A5_TRILO|nr:hypothetical protein M440DRAFT_1375328 [Trichoderma longibrachiatum ATCC 18648]